MKKSLYIALISFSFGCGGAVPPKSEAPETEVAPQAVAPSQPEKEKAPEEAAAEPEPEAEAAKPDANAPREVKYIVTPQGLRIEVAGATFKPTAKPIRVAGGWGVKVMVEATVEGTVLSLLDSKNGPLAFAAKVSAQGSGRGSGEARVGSEERFLTPGEPLKITREWPGSTKMKPLSPGETLELQVGLWGLGEQSETRRPMKKFFVVKMVAGKKTPQPVVSPPGSAE
jgi:hypothetical protein